TMSSSRYNYGGGGGDGGGGGADQPQPQPQHPDDIRLQQMQQTVGEVSDVMRDNMNRIIERDGNINKLVDRTEALQESAVQYSRTTTRVQRKMWWQNTKMKIILAVVVAVIIIIIIMSILASAGVFQLKSA
ncbi:hypothetical protein BOX15_Mlig001836g1, partial [Macrostomum lignano]